MKQLTLTIVIPVYNEEDHIGQCLEAIAAQTVKPLEVLIVDNNCTDKTIEIARKYPFVKVIIESSQGRSAARTAGFNAAKGDIIGRIDADSEVMPGWVERVLFDFKDPGLMGLTGLAQTNLILGLNRLYVTFWARIGFWAKHAVLRVQILWGANMAMRKIMWQRIRDDVCVDDAIVHEDEDVTMLVIGQGEKILQDNKLLIRTAGKSYLYWPKFWEYFKKSLLTKRHHIHRGTFVNVDSSKRDIIYSLPTDLLGLLGMLLFAIYSFVMWPVFACLLHFSKEPRKSLR